MFRRIAPRDLRLGMFLERIDGDWMDHPFWRAGFVLAKPADLRKLQDSAVPSVVIDEGRGVAATPSEVEPLRARSPRRRMSAGARAGSNDPARRFGLRIHRWRRAVRELFLDISGGEAVRADGLLDVVEQMSSSLAENPQAVISLTRLKSMDNYTFLHSVSVAALLIHFYRHLGRDEEEIRLIGMAGLLHDIGKLAVKPAILTKIAPLTDGECAVIRDHPQKGCDILTRSPGIPEIVLDVCLHHHERIDGTGYPAGLSGPELSFHARAAAICDVFDALTSARPYKKAWSAGTALAKMRGWTGAFDLELLAAFTASLGHVLEEGGPDPEPAERTSFSINGYSDPSAH